MNLLEKPCDTYHEDLRKGIVNPARGDWGVQEIFEKFGIDAYKDTMN